MSSVINYGGYFYLSWVLILMPVLGVRSWYSLRSGKPLPPKEKRYQGMIVLQVWLLLFTYIIAHDNEVHLFSSAGPSWWAWTVAAGYMGIIAMRMKAAWQKISAERKERARRLLPENNAHLRYWIPISFLAGLSEECSFRGLAFILLARLWHPAIVVAVCVASFGIAHMTQGWRAVLGTSIIAIVMHALVYLTGGLYMPIAVHAGYDLIVGFVAVRAFSQSRTAAELAQSQAAG